MASSILFRVLNHRSLSSLALRLGEETIHSIIINLSEPYNQTLEYQDGSHVIPANFTWSLQSINSIKTTNSFASYQVIPVEISLLLLSHLKQTMYISWNLYEN